MEITIILALILLVIVVCIVGLLIFILMDRGGLLYKTSGYVVLYNEEAKKEINSESAYSRVFVIEAERILYDYTWKPEKTDLKIKIKQSNKETKTKRLRANIRISRLSNNFKIYDNLYNKQGEIIPIGNQFRLVLLKQLGERGWEWTKNISPESHDYPFTIITAPFQWFQVIRNTIIVQHFVQILKNQQIGKTYKIIRALGKKGSYGTIYLVRQKRTGRIYAAKKLHCTDDESKRRFKREKNILSRLKHDHIVTIHDFIEENYESYIIMEYAEEGSLEDLMNERGRRGLPIDEVIKIGKQLSEALSTVHSRQIIHRDIKPSNVLVFDKEKSKVKLSDFGIALLLHQTRLTRTSGPAPLSKPYAAPEQYRGEYDYPSDIYSLGATLYYLLTGKSQLLFDWDRRHNLIAPREFRNDIPHWLENIIFKCLEKKPEERYQSAAELYQALCNGDANTDQSA